MLVSPGRTLRSSISAFESPSSAPISMASIGMSRFSSMSPMISARGDWPTLRNITRWRDSAAFGEGEDGLYELFVTGRESVLSMVAA
jgi:hypothetical protein